MTAQSILDVTEMELVADSGPMVTLRGTDRVMPLGAFWVNTTVSFSPYLSLTIETVAVRDEVLLLLLADKVRVFEVFC